MTQKIAFLKVRDIDTPIQSRKKKHQTNVSSALKIFQDHLRFVSEIITKNWIFAFPLHVSAGIFEGTCKGRANIQFFAIISEMPQVVLKRFQGRTNISLMFLYPISRALKKSILGVMSDFWLFQPTAGAIFERWNLQSIGLRRKILKYFF